MKMETEAIKYQRIDYLTCRTQLNELGISDAEINKALDDLGMAKEDLCDTHAVKSCRECYHKIKEFVNSGVGTFTAYKDGYEKKYNANADFYLVPARYQGLRHGKIIHKILSNRYEWFELFTVDKNYKESETGEWFDSIGRLSTKDLPEKYLNMTVKQVIALSEKKNIVRKKSAWNLYEMYEAKRYEIYLTTELGSLYVPLKALLDGDVDAIKNRQVNYAKTYTDSKEKISKMIAPLDSKEAAILFNFMKSSK